MKSAKQFGLVVSGITSAFVSTAVITSTCIPEAQAARINRVTNGDFSTDSLTNPNDSTRNNPYITGWYNSTANDTAYTTYLDNYTVDNAANGSLSVRLAAHYENTPNGSVPTFTSISQVLKTHKNKEYQLSYYLANVDEDNANEFQTYVGGNLIDDIVNVPFQGFTQYTYNFVATSKQTELKFLAKQAFAWFNVDNVSVLRVKKNHNNNLRIASASIESVPEPFTLGGTAVAGLLGIWLKRKQAVVNTQSN